MQTANNGKIILRRSKKASPIDLHSNSATMNFKDMATILPWVQIILSGILITLILVQQSSTGAGGTFGGGDGSGMQYTRRGAEKVLFNATIIAAILFVLTAFAALFF